MELSFAHRWWMYALFVLVFANVSPLIGQECSYPPFEKIYVGPYDILTTPEGIFHVTSYGTREKVRALRTDAEGTYVIKFVQQCPVCGRCYSEKKDPHDGYDCPLVQEEVLPHIYCK